MSTDTAVREAWYITTDFFRNGGKYLKGMGPWPTREEALACRFGYETGSGQCGRYFVDRWPDQDGLAMRYIRRNVGGQE